MKPKMKPTNIRTSHVCMCTTVIHNTAHISDHLNLQTNIIDITT